MTRRLIFFIAGSAAVWVVALALSGAVTFVNTGAIWGDELNSSVVCSLTALGLCLVPSTLTFLWSIWGLKQTPDQQLVTVLGGTGIRMFFVLGLGLLLANTVDFLHAHQIKFWLWILVFYLATLALEMILIVRMQVVSEKANKASSPNAPSQ